MRLMKIVMIRHFKTSGNLKRQYIGRLDEPLAESEELKNNEERLKERLKESGEMDAVIASPMQRCIQTAELLFPKREFLLYPKLQECDFGLFEGRNYEELKGLKAYQEWLASMGTLPFPGGESQETFADRCRQGFEEAVEQLFAELPSDRDGQAAMVVHGGTIMAVLSRFGPQNKSFYDWQAENGSGFVIYLEEEQWRQGEKVFREIERL